MANGFTLESINGGSLTVQYSGTGTEHKVLTLPEETDTLAGLDSPAFTGTPTVPTPASGDKSTKIATTAYANSLLAEYTVTVSDASSIDFTGLDINIHKSYRIEVEAISTTTGSNNISLYVNGNTTSANYYNQRTTKATTTVSTTISNNSILTPVSAAIGGVTVVNANVLKVSTGSKIFSRSTESNINDYDVVINPQFATPNITQLTFVHSATGGFGVGSKIRIYRGDV